MEISTLAQSLQLRQQVQGLQGRLLEAQTQLASGKKASLHSELGADTAQVLSLRASAARVVHYQETVGQTETRIGAIQNALQQLGGVGTDSKLEIFTALYENRAKLPLLQDIGAQQLEVALGRLNLNVEGRYLFAGRETHTRPVQDAATVLDGDGTRAGLRQHIAERRVADDVGGDGALDVTVAGGTVTIDDAQEQFGFAVTGVVNGLSNATATTTAAFANGDAETVEVAFTGLPVAGETFGLDLALPDGSAFAIRLTAAAGAVESLDDVFPVNDLETRVATEFTVGATAAETAANLQARLAEVVQRLAGEGVFKAASTVAAGDDFFRNPPQVVDDPVTPTALVDGAAADWVFWYQGDDAADPADSEAVAVIDDATELRYGVRADADALTALVRDLALLAAEAYDPDEEAYYAAFTDRIARDLGVADQGITEIRALLGLDQEALRDVGEQHEAHLLLVRQRLDAIENADPYEVATRLSEIETQLQSSYLITAQLRGLSLTSFL